MNYPKPVNTDFYNETVYNSILDRLDRIKVDAERKWGSMTSAQMLHHLNLAIGGGLGYYNLPDDTNFMRQTVNKFLILNLLQKFPINSPTAKPLKIEATNNFDFETEKAALKDILAKAYQTQTNDDWSKHTYFGKMTRKEWGKLIVIHCNHHFQQFGN